MLPERPHRIAPRKVAIALISIAGLIHLVLAPAYLDEEAYIGVLFLLGAAGCGVVALLLGRDGRDRRAWALGALISVGMRAGFILSRTVGLPGFRGSEWELSGIVSAPAELGFVAIVATGFHWRA